MSTSLLRSSTKLFVLSDFALFSTALGIFRVRAFLFLPFVFCGHYSMLFCSALFKVPVSLFSVRPFHALFLGQLSPSSFLEGLSSEQFAGLGSIHFLGFGARACSLALLFLAVLFLAIFRAVFI